MTPENKTGYNDWRLPTRVELEALLDLTKFNPAIDTVYFPDTQAYYYWSSTTHAGYPGHAWVVSFGSGSVYGYNQDYGNYVRAVRAGQSTWSFYAAPRFVDNGDGTVTDNRTGLMWMQETWGPCTWGEAQKMMGEYNER